ncbi:MAG: ABC transporter substrate-binding protein [Pleomorphochaeta sp.]
MKIKSSDNLYDVITRYPQTKEYFINKGIKQVENDLILSTLAKKITIETITKSKKINTTLFIDELNQILNQELIDLTLSKEVSKEAATIKLDGVLPCPIRIPLLESFDKWLKLMDCENTINYELKAASMGVDWLKNNMKEESLSDIFLSAGFDLFFDDKYINQFKKKKVFKDLISFEKYNSDFDNDYISLKDPKGDYSILGVVPAVFLINEEIIDFNEAPKSWEELISGKFENKVSLPVGDFDLFNAILLNIFKKYGLDGVKQLSKTLLKGMHPSQMVKSNTSKEQPAITIMPYFFTKMIKFGGPMKAIWPKDGAIISPIFMLTKKEKESELLKFVEYFSSKEVGEIFSHKGLFPSTNPNVDNMIPKENKYMWLGWDYINNTDIGKTLDICLSAFENIREV